MTKPFILTIGSPGPLTAIKARRRAMTLSRSKLYRDEYARLMRVKKKSAEHLFQPRGLGLLTNLAEKCGPDTDRVAEAFIALDLPEGIPLEQELLELEVWLRVNGER